MSLKISYKDVITFFDESSPDMSELVLSMVEDRLHDKAEKRAKISANLKKARAARGSKAEVTGNVATPAAPAQRGRPRHVVNDPNENVAVAGS